MEMGSKTVVLVPVEGGTVSKAVRTRLERAGAPFRANDNIAAHLEPGELEGLRNEVAERVAALLDSLLIDRTDPNVKGTAERVAKMYLEEVFAGRYEVLPALTDFPNSKKLDELYSLGPISIRSSCSHHLCPVEGELWCGVIPGERLIGLSKFSRLARWITSRPQMQEEAIVQIADHLEDLIKPRGLGLSMKLKHSCMTWRGVAEHGTTMTSNVMRGILKESGAARGEFMAMIAGQGF